MFVKLLTLALLIIDRCWWLVWPGMVSATFLPYYDVTMLWQDGRVATLFLIRLDKEQLWGDWDL